MRGMSSTVHKLAVPQSGNTVAFEEFQAEVDRCIDSGSGEIHLNCSELSRVTSSHVGALWLAYSKCNEAGVRLKLMSSTSHLIDTLIAMDMQGIIMESEEYWENKSGGGDSLAEVLVQPRMLSVEFNASSDDIERSLDQIRVFIRETGANANDSAAIETVFYEIATNAREHSTLGPDDKIICSVETDSNGAIIRLVDNGEQFDITKADTSFDPEEAIRTGKRRGFGLAMVKKLTDSISYDYRDDKSNVVTLTRYWRD